MKCSHYISNALIVLGLLFVPASFAVAASQAHAAAREVCFADWSQAGPVVRSENLKPVTRILDTVMATRSGKAVKVKLCRRNDDFRYRIAIAGTNGSISWVSVDARSGRIRPLARP